MQHGLGLRLRFSPNGTAVDSHGREPVVRDETAAEVPNGTTGIAMGMSHIVLSGLNMTLKHLTTGSRPWLPPATTFVAQTNDPFAFTMPFTYPFFAGENTSQRCAAGESFVGFIVI